MRRFLATGFWLLSLPFGLLALAIVTIANSIAGDYWKEEVDNDD